MNGSEAAQDYDLGKDFPDLDAHAAYKRIQENATDNRVVLCNFTDHVVVEVSGVRDTENGPYLVTKYVAWAHRNRGVDGEDAVPPHAIYPKFGENTSRIEKAKYAKLHSERVARSISHSDKNESEKEDDENEDGGDDEDSSGGEDDEHGNDGKDDKDDGADDDDDAAAAAADDDDDDDDDDADDDADDDDGGDDDGDGDESEEEGGDFAYEKSPEWQECMRLEGKKIRKLFRCSGAVGKGKKKNKLFHGTVTGVDHCMDDGAYKCRIKYSDGDEEHMTADEVSEHLVG